MCEDDKWDEKKKKILSLPYEETCTLQDAWVSYRTPTVSIEKQESWSTPGLLFDNGCVLHTLLRGAIVNRTYGIHKNVDI